MGEVYLAKDTKLRRDVALKVLPPILVHDPERLSQQREPLRTLRVEWAFGHGDLAEKGDQLSSSY